MLRGHLLDGDRHIDSADLLVVAVLMLQQKSCKQHRIFLLHKSKKIWQKSVCSVVEKFTAAKTTNTTQERKIADSDKKKCL